MYDIAIIGLGIAGLEAALCAAKNGLKVIAFEKNEIGGSYLNFNSIPTKTISYSSQLLKKIEQSSKFGINLFAKPGYNWQIMLDRKIEITNKFSKLLNSELNKNITVVKAEAELSINYDEIEIYADDNIYQAKYIIIATGSKPKELAGLTFDGEFVVKPDDMLKKIDIPKKVAIVGSGSIGLEWAQILSDLGSEVKIIEIEKQLAFNYDVELQKRAEKILKSNKVQIFKNDCIIRVSNDQVFLKSGIAFDVDCILVAIGNESNPCKISINGCAEQFLIKPQDDGSCDIDNLYLAGSAFCGNFAPHEVLFQAKSVMNKILFNKEIENKISPYIINISPEIATIGVKEQDVDLFDGYEIRKISLSSLMEYWCEDCQDGMIKIIIKDDIIVGAHIVSKNASLLISIFSILINHKIKLNEIENLVFPLPSLAHGVLEVLKSE
ncbi:MAG: NAD(P)/FAD-dependent oxidoreductase [Cyanobacteria bacterium SIG27]|nr:NAD(P)/FAD-dependent oxidoreductase [Cyanobacteria bacterium SIG27]